MTGRIALLLLFLFAAPSLAERIDPANDLQYLGAFRMPAGQSGYNLSGYGLTFNPVGNGGQGSLFIVQGDANGKNSIAEISIPTPVNSKTASALNSATQLQAMTNAASFSSTTADQIGDVLYVPAQGTQSTAKLYNTIFRFYNTENIDFPSLGYTELTLSSPSAKGPWHVGASQDFTNKVGWYAFLAPTSWASSYVSGRFLMTGGTRGGGNYASRGPVMYALAPWTNDSPPSAGGNTGTVTPLIQYEDEISIDNPMTPDSYRTQLTGNYTRWGPCDRSRDAIWIQAGTKEAVLFSGVKGTATYSYSAGFTCNPVKPHADWFGVDDITLVAQGSKPRTGAGCIQPFSNYLGPDSGGSYLWSTSSGSVGVVDNAMMYHGLGGVAYQPNWSGSDGRLFIVELQVDTRDGGYYPIVHVFRVLSGAATFTVTPSAGAGGTISPNTAQTVNSGSTTAFTVTPNSGHTASVGGTCGGSLVGTTYTTAAIAADCTVAATFADTEVPTTPTDLDADSPSTSQVSLKWQPSTDNVAVTEYRIDACAGYGCSSWAQIGTSATTSYTHSGLTPAPNPTIYRYRVRAYDAAGNPSGNATSIYFNARPTIPAFPGAEGAGATAMGGRGGTVYRVTSLSGGTEAGTLRACVNATGPRTCVFDVAGNIELTSNVNVSSPYVTIAGHTAPGGGITISGKNSPNVTFTVRTHNVVVRYIRFRKGYNAGTASQDGDSSNVTGASTTSGPVGPVIYDHISASWGQDENAEVWGMTPRAPKNVTYAWAMIYEPLAAHPVNFLTGAYNNATAEAMTDIDLHHSLLANSSHRNPMVKNKTFRLVNNLAYNWADWAYAQLGTVQSDVIGNKFKAGPLYMTASSKAYEIQLDPVGNATTPNVGTASLYVVGNIGPHNADPLADNWPMTRRIDVETNAMAELGALDEGTYRRFSPLAALPWPIVASPVDQAEAAVLAGAGASRRLDCAGNWVDMRDSADARIVSEYNAGTGIIPTTEADVGGYPTLAAGTACTDTDGDGMPDTWENANGLNAASAADGPTIHASGYTNLERYLAGNNDLIAPVLSGFGPASPLAAGTASATLALITDEPATCRYSSSAGAEYIAMTAFSTTGNTSHSASVPTAKGRTDWYYIRCQDGSGNLSAQAVHRLSVSDSPKRRGSR